MKYMGSKRRILKHILPIMLDDMYTNKLTTWVEPFVGGANVIQHVPSKFTRIGSDYFEHTIAALIGIRDHLDSLPDDVSEEYYKLLKGTPADPITSWIRFVCSFAGIFSNAYAREKDSTGRTFAGEGLRNAMVQSPLIQGVDLLVGDYTMHSDKVGCVIYCFDGDTELLTDSGWTNIKDITTAHKCLSRQPNTKVIDYKQVVKTHETKSKSMFYYKSKMLDFSVTSDHNLFVSKKTTRQGIRNDIFLKPDNIKNFNFNFINAGGIWNRETPSTLDINGYVVDTVKFMYLLGIFFTDGSVNNQGVVTISQTKPEIVEKIRNVLQELDLPYSEYSSERNLQAKTFYLKRSWSDFFKQFYLKKDRTIPKDYLNFGVDALEKLLEGILDGDSDNERRRISVGSMNLVNDIQEICYKLGLASNYRVVKGKNTKLECGRIINGGDYYVVSVLKTEYLNAHKNNHHFKDEEKDVYCVTLSEWHTVLTRKNGKCIWMGQCDPPYRSTTGYKGTGRFDYDAFYDWCRKMSKNNIVYVSEYDMPDDFECVWTGNIATNFSSQREGNIVSVAKEKLYRISDLNAEYTFPF